jgi:hypothetical protein
MMLYLYGRLSVIDYSLTKYAYNRSSIENIYELQYNQIHSLPLISIIKCNLLFLDNYAKKIQLWFYKTKYHPESKYIKKLVTTWQ